MQSFRAELRQKRHIRPFENQEEIRFWGQISEYAEYGFVKAKICALVYRSVQIIPMAVDFLFEHFWKSTLQ